MKTTASPEEMSQPRPTDQTGPTRVGGPRELPTRTEPDFGSSVFSDPVAYLARFGIESHLVAVDPGELPYGTDLDNARIRDAA